MINFSEYAPLVTQDDLPEGLTVDDADLLSASDDVRGACGWHIAPRKEDDVLVVDSGGGTLLTLPSLLITEPSAIVDRDDNPITGWTWSAIGQLHREAGWPKGFRAVKVTVTHGLDATPPTLVAVVLDMVRDRERWRSGAANITTASLDGAAIGYGSTSTAGIRTALMDTYGHVLRRYAL